MQQLLLAKIYKLWIMMKMTKDLSAQMQWTQQQSLHHLLHQVVEALEDTLEEIIGHLKIQ